VAVVVDGVDVRSNAISSQVHLHERFGGVVPEVASRAHVERINPMLSVALERAGLAMPDVDAVAATVGPGLVGSLLVGIAAGKALAFALGVPFVGVNHLEGHIYANAIGHGEITDPYVCFLVSGGHTMLVHVPHPRRYVVLGETLDDAAGEAFDKVARFLGLGFPGGPALDRLARDGDPNAIRFPRAVTRGDYDFSLSGLKTAVVRRIRSERAGGTGTSAADLAASFQEAVVEVQVAKTLAAAEAMGAGLVVLGGGVVANSRLRALMTERTAERGLTLMIPPSDLCTDNGAMIAAAGYFRLVGGERTPLDVRAEPSLRLENDLSDGRLRR
jgi:N6-L-threonylcarbamoyladenine synthase